ncbi:SH3 domain-containing protein [Mycena amicta]|nr:SH3 domain-containing protein [Mycena amicta]
MSARRQASTTSLSKYARGDPVPHDRSAEFCNAFWGLADGGVEVLFARMRGATRSMDELRNFWKERASIEEDYARRMAKLSKQALGRDEIGDLRNSFDAIRGETERQSQYHLTLAQQVRSDLEGQTSAFYAKQQHHKKTYQSGIEKEFKAKQLQEGYVAKAREKYETDCMRINSYTAQLGLVQGKDAERIHLKRDNTQRTVQQNERDFLHFSRALAETTAKWEADWKVFCDSCQDLEDERIEFMKDNMWAYANAVSTVCVSDDESCEKMRLALEQMEPERDQENFVRSYGTGNQIPDPPPFVDYKDPNAIPSASARPTYRVANFPRSSQRPPPNRRNSAQPEPEPEPDDTVNSAGVGTVRRGDVNVNGVSRQNTQHRANIIPQQPQPQQAIGSFSPMPSSSTATLPAADLTSTNSKPSSHRIPPPDAPQAPIDPTADTYIKVGDNTYQVDLSKDPRGQAGPSKLSSSPPAAGSAFDPFAKQMAELQSAGETVRRKSTRRGTIDTSPNGNHASTRPSSSMSLVAPGAMVPAGSQIQQHRQNAHQQQQQQRSPSPGRDYRHSAEMVVGTHPAASRPSSPAAQPITAAFMRPASGAPPGADMVADVLTDYQQSLPGERKSVSRSGSRRGSYVGERPTHGYNPSQSSQHSFNQQQQHGAALTRTPSQGFAGVGAHSRSTSPAPQMQQSISRGPSPAPAQMMALARVPSFIAPPPPPSQLINRSPSPNTVGIALDSSGRVMHDEMAQRYQGPPQPQSQPHQLRQSMPPQQQQPPYNPGQSQRRVSSMGPGGIAVPPPPPLQALVGPVAPYQHPGYQQAQPQPSYSPQPYHHPQQQQGYQQPQQAYGGGLNGHGHGQAPQRGMSMSGSGWNQPPPQPQVQQQLVRAQQPPSQQLVRAPQQLQHPQYQHPQRSRSPSPQAPHHQTSDGKLILFFVKALFSYTATIEEEFDFQEGDIIAVTSTPEDGWWSGELLDEGRRVPGKHVFPSNFVELFP